MINRACNISQEQPPREKDTRAFSIHHVLYHATSQADKYDIPELSVPAEVIKTPGGSFGTN